MIRALDRSLYLQGGGNHCPFCESEQIEGGFIETDSGTSWQPVKCNDCKKEWKDIYKLVDVEEME
jgi:hypothetical protein